jgi:hypothetical protein
MESTCSPEMSVFENKTARCHNPKHHNINNDRGLEGHIDIDVVTNCTFFGTEGHLRFTRQFNYHRQDLLLSQLNWNSEHLGERL